MKLHKTVAFSKDATNVFFHILTQCNLSCRHCYINPEQHGREMLPLSTIVSWLEVFSRKAASANLILLGGEPTLHPDLPEVIRAARRMGFASITVDTNGYLFHDVLSKVSPAELDFISFSLDGATAEVNDRIRGKGSYRQCLDGVRQAVERGFSTSMIYTVSQDNIHELADMPALIEDIGIDRFFFQVIGIRGQSAQGEGAELQLTRHQWLNTVPAVAGQIADLGISVTWPKVFLDDDQPFECAGLVADNYFIFPNGRVYRCPLCEDFPVHSLKFSGEDLVKTGGLNEANFFQLRIPEGCVMNRLIQPGNITYAANGEPNYRIACCLLKEEISAS